MDGGVQTPHIKTDTGRSTYWGSYINFKQIPFSRKLLQDTSEKGKKGRINNLVSHSL